MNELKPVVRCAIYTRKSSEEGLEQSFNSLDAQREACEAFILSQRQEGWRALPGKYDDGGFSGGTLERPALQRLLQDIDAHKVDTIVVYKVDRLTRSLADFAKIVEALDSRGASFVSVTQQFNSTTSMGRLTLNVLLSFAQFEREVTGERIRDKIAASKRKGMWMGGTLPLGYDLKERKLIVNCAEAKLVCDIYRQYLKLGCVSKLKAHLDRSGRTSKVRTSVKGRQSGGASYSRGALYQILNNRIYLGEIPHREQSYPGEHDAIVPQRLWQQVQTKMKSDHQYRRNGLRMNSPSLLAGLLEDAKGHPVTPSHTVKNGKRYRYYVSSRRKGSDVTLPHACMRVPAHEIESRVLAKLRSFLQSGDAASELASLVHGVSTEQQLANSAASLAQDWPSTHTPELRELCRKILKKVVLHQDKLEICLSKSELLDVLLGGERRNAGLRQAAPTKKHTNDDLICLTLEARLTRVGGETTLVIPADGGKQAFARPVPSLLKAVAQGRAWFEQVLAGKSNDQRSLARQMGVSERYAGRMCECAFLAPDIVEAILEGRQPLGLTFGKLTQGLPMVWSEQRSLLGFDPS